MRLIAAATAILAGGCALTTPAPVGPIRPGTTPQIQASWAVAYGRANATVDGAPLAGNGQEQVLGRSKVVDPLPNPLPLTLGVRQALNGTLDAGVDFGWVDSGLDLRTDLSAVGDSMPIVLCAGLRSGAISYFAKNTYDGRLTLELYPDLSRARDRSFRLIFSVGVAAGVFAHEMILPEGYQGASDAPTGPPVARIQRREVRFQTSIGTYWHGTNRGVSLTISPWFLLRASDPTSTSCKECDGHPAISNFSQTWGVALIVAPTLDWPHAEKHLQASGS